MIRQVTDTIMMVRPAAFHLNEETAVNNFFQQQDEDISNAEAQKKALSEFDHMVAGLISNGIDVVVFQDTKDSGTPDSIFCNNWNSFHEDGSIFLYPMFAENRRKEIKEELLASISEKFQVNKTVLLRSWEIKNQFLEGTGSMILDRENNLAYASLSDRTHLRVLLDFANQSGFELVTFTAYQTANEMRLPIYHTNVMMCVGEGFSVICLDAIDDEVEKNKVQQYLLKTGKELIEISEDQCNQFAGNMLQLMNREEKRFIVMSESAYQSLTNQQVDKLSKYGGLLHYSLDTIEKFGGGSARCMMAEIFLQPKSKL